MDIGRYTQNEIWFALVKLFSSNFILQYQLGKDLPNIPVITKKMKWYLYSYTRLFGFLFDAAELNKCNSFAKFLSQKMLMRD